MKINYWTDEEIKIFKDNYGKVSENEMLVLIPNRTKSALRMKAEHLGIRNKQRTNFCNEDFFSIPNLLNSYWAGFIAADGYLFANNTRLGIILSSKDKDQIFKFADDIEFVGRFIERKRAFSTRPNKLFEQFGLQINSSKICSDLIRNYNIHSNKSLTLIPPENLSLKNETAFIIGYIDGDGSVNMQANSPFISIRGTLDIIAWIKKHLDILLNKSSNPLKNGNTFIYTITCNKAKIIFNYLKDFDVPKLERKWGWET